jgi:hypothetical protein
VSVDNSLSLESDRNEVLQEKEREIIKSDLTFLKASTVSRVNSVNRLIFSIVGFKINSNFSDNFSQKLIDRYESFKLILSKLGEDNR